MARVALVTGGTRGIGASISKALKAAGYNVAASYAGNDAAAEKFKSETGIPVYKWDVASFDACAAGVKKVEADLGPVDVLVNNAGITKDTAFHKMTLDQWQAVIDVNLTGVFLCGREAAERMITGKVPGVIINISSISRAGNAGQTNYSAAKAGVAAMAVTWAKELARYGIRAASIAPGFINTEMVAGMKPEAREKLTSGIPLKRMGEPDEIAQTVEFILQNDYVSGRCFEIDGALGL